MQINAHTDKTFQELGFYMLMRHKYTFSLKQRIANFGAGLESICGFDHAENELDAMRDIYLKTYKDVCDLEINAMRNQNVKNLESASNIMNSIIPLENGDREFASYINLTINAERVARFFNDNTAHFMEILSEWRGNPDMRMEVIADYIIRYCRFVNTRADQEWTDTACLKRQQLIAIVYETMVVNSIRVNGIEKFRKEISTRKDLLLPVAFLLACCGVDSVAYIQRGERESVVKFVGMRYRTSFRTAMRLEAVMAELGSIPDTWARSYEEELKRHAKHVIKLIAPLEENERKMEAALCSAEVYVKVIRDMPQEEAVDHDAQEEEHPAAGDGNIDRLLSRVLNERRIDPTDILVSRDDALQATDSSDRVAIAEPVLSQDEVVLPQAAQQSVAAEEESRTARNRRKNQQRKARAAENKRTIAAVIDEVCGTVALGIAKEIVAEEERIRNDAIADIITSIVDETMSSIAEKELMAKKHNEAMASVVDDLVAEIIRDELVALNKKISLTAQARVLFDARSGAQFSEEFNTSMANYLFANYREEVIGIMTRENTEMRELLITIFLRTNGRELINHLTRDNRDLRDSLIRSFLQANFAEDKPECFMCLSPLTDIKAGFFASCCVGASYVCAECVKVDHGHPWVVRPALERAVGL
jgi:hypothetical protein